MGQNIDIQFNFFIPLLPFLCIHQHQSTFKKYYERNKNIYPHNCILWTMLPYPLCFLRSYKHPNSP